MKTIVRFTRNAEKQLLRLPKDIQRRVDKRLSSLASAPRAGGAARLEGEEQMLRVRVGDYRILYEIDNAAGALTVIAVVHRGKAYRKLNRLH